MKNAAFFLCLFSAFTTRAQLIDSLPTLIRQKSSIDARLESRLGFINNEFCTVNGVRGGLAFVRKLRLGAGLSWLNSPIDVDVPPYPTIDGYSTTKHLKFGYICLYADIVFYKTKRWQLSVPLQFGGGRWWLQDREGYQLKSSAEKKALFLYEPGITIQYKIFRWFGLGNDIAYRFAMQSADSPIRFSSPTYAFKILFWPDQLYFMAFPKTKISEKYGPAYW